MAKGLSDDYADLVSDVTRQIKDFDSSCADPPTRGSSLDEFCNAVISFAKSRRYPGSAKAGGVAGPASLREPINALDVLTFFLADLQALKMVAKAQGGAVRDSSGDTKAKVPASLGQDITELCESLGVARGDGDPAETPLARVEQYVTDAMSKLPKSAKEARSVLDRKSFSQTQVEVLGKINAVLSRDYRVRHKVLLKRFDLTLQSFIWSDKGKKKKDVIMGKYAALETDLPAEFVHVSLDELFAARPEVLALRKITDTESRVDTRLKRAVIGAVPDRGGRVGEGRVPTASNMPRFRSRAANSDNWKDRVRGRGRGRGGGRRGGGRRGSGRWKSRGGRRH